MMLSSGDRDQLRRERLPGHGRARDGYPDMTLPLYLERIEIRPSA